MHKGAKTLIIIACAMLLTLQTPTAQACMTMPAAKLEISYSGGCLFAKPYATYEEQGFAIFNTCAEVQHIRVLHTKEDEKSKFVPRQDIGLRITLPEGSPKPGESPNCPYSKIDNEGHCDGIVLPQYATLYFYGFGEEADLLFQIVTKKNDGHSMPIIKGRIKTGWNRDGCQPFN
ncbi:MAG TPA: hypothetical protein VHP34_10695 [Alphaproteobacteria bacterium]|nr:hypothetical protein [Alphaproteobacteria bacterium]